MLHGQENLMQANAKCLDVVPGTSERTLLLSQQDGLQQIRFNIPPRPGDLASRIVDGFMQTYHVKRGLPVSPEHRDAIEQIAIAIQLVADRGPIFPLLFLLSTLPTGA